MVDQVKTFEEVERELYAREDRLLASLKKVDRKPEDVGAEEIEIEKLAADWVRYTRMNKQNGNTPRYGVAIKHAVALNGPINELDKRLLYGRVESLQETQHQKIPILELNGNNLFVIKSLDGFFTPYVAAGYPDRIAEVSFNAQKVQNCRTCPKKGVCNLGEICRSYDPAGYSSLAQSEKPTLEDMRAFDEYAKTVKRKSPL